MARRVVTMNEIVEMIYQWHQGAGYKRIVRSLGFDRKTVRKYVRLAQKVEVARGEPFPEESELISRLREVSDSHLLRETPAQDLLVPHRQWMAELLKEKEMTAKQVWRLLAEQTDLSVSYPTVKRYLRAEFQFGAPQVTIRLEVEPGSQAQVDFGYAGMMMDPSTGKRRRAWAFVMTLSYSRHRFVRFVFRQDIPTWIDCHVRAFEFFGGVAASVVLDNLKSGVLKPDIYDPTLNRAYAELERHYGFVADPAKVGIARHKGKVERVIPVVRRHLLAGREFRDIEEVNERALRWAREEIGMEIHGTTKRKPFEVFQKEELAHLKPLAQESFECPVWKECSVHPDHHVVFDRSYYSVPTRFIGSKVWVRAARVLVKIFLDGQLIKTHFRAQKPGTWVTDTSDYPPQKLAYLMSTPSYCRNKAAEIGPHTKALICEILSQHAMRNLRKAQAILRLAEKYGNQRMEAASERSLFFGNLHYRAIKRILENGLDEQPQPRPIAAVALSPLGLRFLRDPIYFAATKEVTS
ncbi:MAG: IS21 family transposase [Anaerolineae bacterium]|nr:IS21 family transposase [Anaerolineae bacterium]NIS72183.1 IS21 family transposase [Pseudomonadota bacterium]